MSGLKIMVGSFGGIKNGRIKIFNALGKTLVNATVHHSPPPKAGLVPILNGSHSDQPFGISGINSSADIVKKKPSPCGTSFSN